MEPLQYQVLEGPPAGPLLEEIAELNERIFRFGETAAILGPWLQLQRGFLTCTARREGTLVGFKLGFEVSPRKFESWRGGVAPEERRQGIASQLMQLQHRCCAERGYRVITTDTVSDNRGMLILNLLHGFEVVGTLINRKKKLRVVQEKWLEP